MHIYPDYYEKFRCIADKCKHNCCIGWEIDIDENTLSYYNSLSGDFADRLKENIGYSDTAFFKLIQNDRCPFLNSNNLCDIIINLGENRLCDICAQHPRFHNELPDRVESGLGLSCEEACRLILSQKEKATLIGNTDTDDEIILLRDKVIDILQNRAKSISDRIDDMLSLCNYTVRQIDTPQLCDVLLSLERLDDNWTTMIQLLKKNHNQCDTTKFTAHMADREHEYEQFVVYLVYRHLANSPDFYEFQKRAAFVAVAFRLMYSLAAVIFSTTGDFSFETQVEIMRLFSGEIEYSDENLYALFNIL